jgi:hypothetical protein
MFDYLSHPYLRWLRDKSQDDRPGFNVDRDALSPQALLQYTVNFPTPEPHVSLPPAVPTGLADFVVEQPNELPGFRVGMRDDARRFNLNENDAPPPEREPSPETSDIAETSTLPPGVEEPEPAPQIPQWLYNVLTIPVPRLSTAIDPETGRRIVPYEPLINWTRPYPTVDQNVRGTDAVDAYGPEIRAMPGPSSIEVPAINQWVPSAPPERLPDINPPAASPPPMVRQARWNPWPQPLKDGQTGTQTSSVDAGDPWRSVVQPLQQQTPFPQEQQTQLANVPETTFGKESAGIQPTPFIGPSPIEHSVYRPDIDPGYDELFDLVGVGENKAQGDAARDAEAARIKNAYPDVPFAQEIRLYAKDVSGYMKVDIMFRPNGTSMIMIFEVKSGNAVLSPQQLATLVEAVRTGEIYIVNEEAAKKFGLRPYETFASKRILPFVYVTGGNQDAITRQLNKQGVEAIPQTTRRGQVPRLRIGVRPP